MSKIFSILAPRVAGTVAAWLAGFLFMKTKGVVTVDPTMLVEVATAMIGTYAVAHRAVSSKVNPSDSASGRMIVAVQDAVSTGTAVVPEVKH